MKTTTINNVTNTIAIISFWGDAPEYNHELSHDGGSYYQPCGVALLRIGNQYVVVELDDASCGDFGSRVRVSIECDTHKWMFTFGTMDDASIDTEDELEKIWLSAGTVLGIGNLWDVINVVRDAVDTAVVFGSAIAA